MNLRILTPEELSRHAYDQPATQDLVDALRTRLIGALDDIAVLETHVSELESEIENLQYEVNDLQDQLMGEDA